MGDQVVVLLNLLLAFLDLTLEVVDLPVLVLSIQLRLVQKFDMGLKLPLDIKDFILLFVDVPLLLLDDVVLLLVLFLLLVVLFSIVLNN